MLAVAGEESTVSWEDQGRQEHGWFGHGTALRALGGETGVDNKAAADQLLEVAQAAYDRYPRDCSHLVNEVLRKLVDPNEPYRTANDLMANAAHQGSGWQQVTMQQASELANQGKVVIAGLAERHGHGHVLVLVPGLMRPAGGFSAHGWTLPQTRDQYPPAVSGSLGGWPGAISRGEKTAKDAWSERDWKNVTFWVRH